MVFNMDSHPEINHGANFNNLKKSIDQLSAEQKVELIKDLSKQLEVPLNTGGQIFIHADLVMQINSGDSSLDELFLAAANLIARRRKDSE
jgi:hypothetical protein